MKEKSSHWNHRNTKDCKKILWTICQQIGQSGRNGQIAKKIISQWGEGFSGTTIKDTWTKPRGRVEAGEGGGFGWGGVEG